MSEDEDEFSSAEDDDMMRAPRGNAGGDDFEDFEESAGHYGGGSGGVPGGGSSQVMTNQPFDEAVELSDSEAADTPQASPAGKGAGRGAPPRGDAAITNQPFDEAVELSSEGSVDDREEDQDQDQDEEDSMDAGTSPEPTPNAKTQMGSSQGMGAAARAAAAPPAAAPREPPPSLSAMRQSDLSGNMGGMSGGGDDEDVEFGGAGDGPIPEGLYDPAEFEELEVSAEIRELFQYITRYKAHNIELETKMRPFIPDYIPAVGDIDPFIKVPRPDGKADNLGLMTLDEPASVQSDPTVLTLQLRAVTKSSGAQPMLVRSVEHAEKNPKAITGWIASIGELHRHKPPPSVRYTKPMPDIEQLMQIWPAPVEEMLDTMPLPDAEISLDLASYVRTVCTMLDIPIYANITESLHVLFTLYSDFKANVHFQQQLSTEQQGGGGYVPGGNGGDGGDDFDSYDHEVMS